MTKASLALLPETITAGEQLSNNDTMIGPRGFG